MKNSIIIIIFFSAIQLFSQSAGHDFSNPVKENQISETQLSAFSHRAKQKLQDFDAALQIIGNSEYTTAMREKSKNAALKLFENENVIIKNKDFSLHKKNASIAQYLNHLQQNPQKTSIQNIAIKKDFSRVSTNLYQASYQFSWQLGEKKYPFMATLLLKKTTKNFGSTQKEVWEIVIGELKEG